MRTPRKAVAKKEESSDEDVKKSEDENVKPDVGMEDEEDDVPF